MLWKVNISLVRRISLMVLFSGAAFIMVAGTIRAVVIVTAGPEGAVSGSQWACRETFVSIIVSNLPIIHPLIRRGANKVGLSHLFSSKGHTSRSLPLESREGRSGMNGTGRGTVTGGSGKGKKSRLGRSRPSDEYILTQDEDRPKDITVTQETIVHSDPWDQSSGAPSVRTAAPSRDDWQHERADNSRRDHNFSADARPTAHY